MKKSEEKETDALPANEILAKLLGRGIPVREAHFHSAVNNGDKTPENYFSSESGVPSRHVKMWWINGDGLLCLHKGKYFMTPSANVKFHVFE